MKFAESLHELGAMLQQRSIILIISDFLNMEGDWEEKLKLTAAKHEVICLVLNDPRDLELPAETGDIMVGDLQSGEQLLINTADIKADYEKTALDHKNMLIKVFKDNFIDHVFVRTDESFVKALYTFFRSRGLQAMGG